MVCFDAQGEFMVRGGMYAGSSKGTAVSSPSNTLGVGDIAVPKISRIVKTRGGL